MKQIRFFIVASALAIFSVVNLHAQENDGPLSLLAVGKAPVSNPQEGATLCDDMDSLTVGILNGQTSDVGVLWNSFDGTVVDAGGGDLEGNQINTFADDGFFAEIFADTTAAVSPSLDAGMVISFDYVLTDLGTDRFYSPQDANVGFILTRLGDSDGDGNWDVLETNGAGGGVFVATGFAIPLSGHVEMTMLNLDLSIDVNGVTIYTGGIIGANGDPGITPGETLTAMVYNSANNSDGFGSEQNIDNLGVNDTSCGAMGCTNAVGDINGDGLVNLSDVNPFVALLTTSSFQCEADVNEDGLVNLSDVNPFVVILTGG